MYNNVVERCFQDCVDSFRRKDLDNTEERVSYGRSGTTISFLKVERDATTVKFNKLLHMQCITRCCEKFMKHSARVGMRFGELSSQAEQQMQQVMQQQTGR